MRKIHTFKTRNDRKGLNKSRNDDNYHTGDKKRESRQEGVIPQGALSLGGDYLLSHFRSTIGVVRLNFSVRNGKRWDPHAIITLVSLVWTARHGVTTASDG